MNKRIRMVRDELDLTRAAFGAKLGVSGDVINNLERGRVEAKESMIKLICSVYSVDETWLRTGEGEMFQQRTRDDELTAFMDELLAEESSDFRRRLVTALSRFSPKQWDALEVVVLGLLEEEPASTTPKPNHEMTIEEAHRELDRQFAEEKRPAENPSASGS